MSETHLRWAIKQCLSIVIDENDDEANDIWCMHCPEYHRLKLIQILLRKRANDGKLLNYTNVNDEKIQRWSEIQTYRSKISEIYRNRCIALIFMGRLGAAGATKDVMRIIARVVYGMRDL